MSWGIRALSAAFFATSFQLCTCDSALAAPPVEAFGSLPFISDARLSPDGKHLAVVGPIGGRDAITVFTLDKPDAKPMRAAFPDADAVGIQWANSNRLICTFKANVKRKDYNLIEVYERAISVAMDGGPAAILMHDAPFYGDTTGTTGTGARDTAGIVDKDPADPDHVYMIAYETADQMAGKLRNFNSFVAEGNSQSEKFVNDVYFLNFFKVSVSTGDTELVFHGRPETIEYVTDGRGHIVGRIDRTSDLKDHYLIGAREVATYDATGGDLLQIEGIAADGTQLTAASYGQSNTWGLYGYQFGSSSLGAPLFSDANYDMTYAFKDEWTGHVGGVSWIGDKVEYKYFDPAIEHIKTRIEHVLPGQSIAVISRDQASANFVIRAEAPKSPTTFYLFNTPTGQLSIVGSSYPSLTAADLGDEKPYLYKSADGTDIHSYLTLPPGRLAKNLPTIILPHGGPADRDELQFDWLAQFLASRGYAVLQPNFRGSDGYGVKFRDAGDGQWTGKVLEDINGGRAQLIKDGIADPKRVCIMGASYGGYAALAAATFTPDLYACAISYAGPSDLQRDLSRVKRDYGEHSQALSVWEKREGARISDTTKLEAMSPAMHANQVKAPILLIHSDKDVTVYLEQSEEERDALQSAGKTVQFVKLEGDDHNLRESATRIQMLKATEAFLAQHLGT
jgi:dipeptidyl aminopeptidase/acylaminoacyl peptidase